MKLFLHITADEQMRRFRSRLTNPLKRWKLSYEDFRNRGRWKDYETAIEDMMEKTSNPWDPSAPHSRQRQVVWAPCGATHHRRPPQNKDVSLEPRPLDPKVIDAAEALLGVRLPARSRGIAATPSSEEDRRHPAPIGRDGDDTAGPAPAPAGVTSLS